MTGTYQVERAEPGADLDCCFSTDDPAVADKHYENAVRLISACGGETRLVHTADGERTVLGHFKRAK